MNVARRESLHLRRSRIMAGSVKKVPAVVAGVVVATACGGAIEPQSCASDDAVDLAHSLCLDFGQAGDLAVFRSEFHEEVERTIGAVVSVMAIGPIRVRILPDPQSVIPEIGLGGYAPSESEIRIFADPRTRGLPTIIRSELLPILAHEIHHAERWRAIGYGSTVYTAAISEGLADHFAMQVAGIPPRPWSVALSGEELELWMAEVLASTGPYDHAQWFLGADPEIPRWTGYAVGYELVRQYFERNPGATAASLVGEPARSFRP